MIEKKIGIRNSEKEFSVEILFDKLQNTAGNAVNFCLARADDLADYYIRIIGNGEVEFYSYDGNCYNAQEKKTQIKIIIVKASVFEQYEKWVKSGRKFSMEIAAFESIDLYNTGDDRNWIYSYNSIGEAYDLVSQIIFSDVYTFSVKNRILTIKSRQIFSNSFMLLNNGCSTLTGFYIEISEQLVSTVNDGQLYVYTSIIPADTGKIDVVFKAPEEAGIYAIYVTLRNENRSLKRQEAVLNFLLQVDNDTGKNDVSVKKEFPAQGEIYFDKHVFEKKWVLENNTNEDWEYIILKAQNRVLLHLYSLDWQEEKYYNIKARQSFHISTKMYTPDIPGSYVQYWELFRPDGSQISTNTPLRCCVQTQYDAVPEFEIMDRTKTKRGILDRLKLFTKK